MIGPGLGGNFPRGKGSQKKNVPPDPTSIKVDPIVIGKHSIVSTPKDSPESQQANDNPRSVKVDPVILRKNKIVADPKDLTEINKAKEEFKKSGWLGVGFVGQLRDNCGYGEAARNYVSALQTTGVNVAGFVASSSKDRPDYGEAGRLSELTIGNKIPYAIKIILLTPQCFEQHHEPGIYKIGFFYWETDRLPGEWVFACNSMDEVWVSCKWTAEVARNSGVHKPIYVFPNCLLPQDYELTGRTALFSRVDPSTFKFLSVFQWTKRKNPEGLLRAYLNAFSDQDRVVLVIKTHLVEPGDINDHNKVLGHIKTIIEREQGTAPVYVITKSLSQQEMVILHRTCDAFVLIHRAEGFGLPLFEATAMGKPVISTGYSAPLEFLNAENSYLVNYHLTSVSGMEGGRFKWYQRSMNWAEPNVEECSGKMRKIYENSEEARQKGLNARKYVLEHFSWRVVGNKMRDRLKEIMRLIS